MDFTGAFRLSVGKDVGRGEIKIGDFDFVLVLSDDNQHIADGNGNGFAFDLPVVINGIDAVGQHRLIQFLGFSVHFGQIRHNGIKGDSAVFEADGEGNQFVFDKEIMLIGVHSVQRGILVLQLGEGDGAVGVLLIDFKIGTAEGVFYLLQALAEGSAGSERGRLLFDVFMGMTVNGLVDISSVKL